MTQFLGTHKNRLDAKGRVSIPAPFRALLKVEPDSDTPSLVLRPSHTAACIEGWPAAVFDAVSSPLTRLDVFSQELNDLAATMFADANPMQPDREGRIVLPDDLIAHANLTDAVTFMGMGRTFLIWEPEAAQKFRTESRERARAQGMTVAASPPH